MTPKTTLAAAEYVCICIVAVASPWFFGAWEMWWFWPFTALIFLSMMLFAGRMMLGSTGIGIYRHSSTSLNAPRLIYYAFLCHLVFLAYALVRTVQADVFMDAERSFLLLMTPALLAIQVLFGMSRQQRRVIFYLVLVSITCIGIYGIVNHLMFHSKMVLWTEGEAHYQKNGVFRATGTYFCPDHYAGILELGFCMALGLLLDRKSGWMRKSAAVLVSCIALAGIIFSKSRGGGITVIVIICAVLVWGFSQWPRRTRWLLRGAAAAAVTAAIAVFCFLGKGYVDRFISYFKIDENSASEDANITAAIKHKLRTSARGHMYSGAFRAWKTSPIIGIGPGMHQQLWPHFATSPDGDRENAEWPRYSGKHFHSYEVHSDWLQFLEEYGLLGMILFMPSLCILFFFLARSIHSHIPEAASQRTRHDDCYPYIMAGFLAFICMAFHSLGDFNLQMPATVWVLSCIVAVATGFARTDEFRPE